MSFDDRSMPSGPRRQRGCAWIVRAVLLLIVGAAQGCASAPKSPMAGPDPADPNVRVAPVTYRSVIGDFNTVRPVEPAQWGTPAPQQMKTDEK